jgi:predicted nucleic acid-binding protein
MQRVKFKIFETTEINKINVVSNTGPMVSAFQCDRIDLLKRYFSLIYITPSEREELNVHGWIDEVNQLIAEGFVVVEALTNSEKIQAEVVAKRIAQLQKSANSDWHDDLAEAEAIVLMQHRKNLDVAMILLDEKAARQVARQLGLNLTGFPGVLGRAGLDGVLTKDEIRQLLKMCQQQGTFYSDRLIETLAENYGK